MAASNPRQQATRPSAWCGSLALWQSGSLAVWHMFLTTSRPRCSTSLQHLDARPRDAEAAATRFRTTGAFLSSPRIAPGHQVLPSRFVQTPPSALCTLPPSTSLLFAAPSAIYLSPLVLFGAWAETARPSCFEEGPTLRSTAGQNETKGSQKIEFSAPTTHGKGRHPIRSPSGL